MSGIVLILGSNFNVRRIVDDFLHDGLDDEVVEGIKLLTNEAFLFEVSRYNGPHMFLCDLPVVFQIHVSSVLSHT